MGLSSSQARLLLLTSRLSDIELQEVMISQRQSQLARKSQEAAEVYSDAMNNYKLTIRVVDPDDEDGYIHEDLSYDNMTAMGYIATTSENQVMLKKDAQGNWIIPKDSNGNELLSINEETGKAVIGTEEFEIFDGSKYLAQPSVLQQAIMNGTVFLYDTKAVEDADEPIPLLQSEVEYQYVLDTSDDAAAESKYDYETAKLSQQDNNLEMDLKQLETQHEAVMKEYESVKEVISNNVERTFNLFSNG